MSWFHDELEKLIERDGVVCSHCGKKDRLFPDPGAYYMDAVDKQGNRVAYLCMCQQDKEKK